MKRSVDRLISGIIGLVTQDSQDGQGLQGTGGGGAANPGEAFMRALGGVFAGASMEQRKNAQALCRRIMAAAGNVEYDIALNGERALIERVCAAGDVVFDVGANQGAWTRTVLEAAPGAFVHCFELIPRTAAALEEALRGLPDVRVNKCGLAEAPGEREAFHVEERSELSGLYRVHGAFAPKRVMCRLTTGDLYAERMKIERIRLLKLDCEGYDYSVLEGCQRLLKKRRVDVVQFEYGYANIQARHLLVDFHERLEGLGYVLGKLYPDGVDFKPYEVTDEDFLGPNYVACRGDDAALRERLTAF